MSRFSVVRGGNALLAGVRLPDVSISVTGPYDVGALAGFVGNGAAVRTSYASGTIAATVAGSAEIHAGGLVGRTGNSRYGSFHIAASYARVGVTVTADDPAAAPHTSVGVGSLVGAMDGAAGGQGRITAVYGNGRVRANWASANPPVGGLYGTASVTRVRASYWNVTDR